MNPFRFVSIKSSTSVLQFAVKTIYLRLYALQCEVVVQNSETDCW